MWLIDAEAVRKSLRPYEKADKNWVCTGSTAIKLIHKAINSAPTVDSVPIVRCRDCKFCAVKIRYFCEIFGSCVNDNGFCDHGKNKGEK